MDTFIPSTFTLDDAIQRLDMALGMVREIKSPTAEAWALLFLFACVMTRGDYTRALTCATLGMSIAEETGHRELICGLHTELGALYHDLFALDQAREHLELALTQARDIGHSYFPSIPTTSLVPVYIQQGQLPQPPPAQNTR